jgi:hypothetical protein
MPAKIIVPLIKPGLVTTRSGLVISLPQLTRRVYRRRKARCCRLHGANGMAAAGRAAAIAIMMIAVMSPVVTDGSAPNAKVAGSA